MSMICRRQFLNQVGVTGAAFAAVSSRSSGAQVQAGTSNRARVIADPARTIATNVVGWWETMPNGGWRRLASIADIAS